LTPLDVLEKEAEKRANYVHPHGLMVLQQMLYFNKPIKLVQNLMELKKDDLVHVLSDKKGSFVADAFCASKFVGEKSRDKLIKHLNDHFLDLALSQFGSRTLETLYNVGNAGHKALIVGELSKKRNQLNSTKFGRIINAKFCCFAFGRGEQPWQAALNSTGRAETLFKDLVPIK
jgi:nucleolar protein 9